MRDQVKVRVTVEKRERYSRDVMMSRDQFDEYERKLESDDRSEYRSVKEEIGEIVDGHDWIDREVEEIDEFSIVDDD